MASLLAPQQLGFGIKGGAEAAVHTVRQYLDNLQANHATLKLDFSNMFNSVYMDKMLDSVHSLAPNIFAFVHSAYCTPLELIWGDKYSVSKAV